MAQRPALSFSHFGFYVRDLERMADFYTRVLGFAISDRGDLDTPWYVMQPLRIPMDMSLSDKELWRWAENNARGLPGYQPVADWSADLAKRLNQ